MSLLLAVLSFAVAWWALQEVMAVLANAQDLWPRDRREKGGPTALRLIGVCLALGVGTVAGFYAFDELSEAEGRLMMTGLFVFIVFRLRKHVS